MLLVESWYRTQLNNVHQRLKTTCGEINQRQAPEINNKPVCFGLLLPSICYISPSCVLVLCFFTPDAQTFLNLLKKNFWNEEWTTVYCRAGKGNNDNPFVGVRDKLPFTFAIWLTNVHTSKLKAGSSLIISHVSSDCLPWHFLYIFIQCIINFKNNKQVRGGHRWHLQTYFNLSLLISRLSIFFFFLQPLYFACFSPSFPLPSATSTLCPLLSPNQHQPLIKLLHYSILTLPLPPVF